MIQLIPHNNLFNKAVHARKETLERITNLQLSYTDHQMPRASSSMIFPKNYLSDLRHLFTASPSKFLLFSFPWLFLGVSPSKRHHHRNIHDVGATISILILEPKHFPYISTLQKGILKSPKALTHSYDPWCHLKEREMIHRHMLQVLAWPQDVKCRNSSNPEMLPNLCLCFLKSSY